MMASMQKARKELNSRQLRAISFKLLSFGGALLALISNWKIMYFLPCPNQAPKDGKIKIV